MKAKQFKWLVTTIMLVAAMVMPSAAWAYDQPVEGDGTKDNPYKIYTSSELFWFAGLVNGTLGDVAQNTDACAELMGDISVGSEWTPIMGFNGTFDGKGYAISNLRYDHTYSGGTSGIGLFGIADSNSEIRNVGIVNCYFRGASYVGGLCGDNSGTIKNCYVTGYVYSADVSTCGGICGYNQGTIENCYSTAQIGTDGSGRGISGLNDGTITNCYYLNSAATGGIEGTEDVAGTTEGKTTEQFRSGEVCYLLNSGKTDGSQAWYQNVWGDDRPVLTRTWHSTVYGGFEHGGNTAQFSNDARYHAHAYDAYAIDEANGNHDKAYQGVFNWTDNDDKTDATVTATFTCDVCGKVETPDMTAVHDDDHTNAAATCTEIGYNYYKASYSFPGETFTEYYTQEVPALGHDDSGDVTFNSGYKIYEKHCNRCSELLGYYATSDGSVEAIEDPEGVFTANDLTLQDATKYDNQAVFTATNFTYTRTFSNSNWTTWYVPFELTLTEEICAHYDFSRINNVHQYDEDNDGTADKTVVESFRQTAGVTLKANYPYLVKPVSDGDMNMMLPLEGVKPALAETNSIDCQSVDFSYTFTGTYADMGEGGSGYYAPYTLWTDGTWQHFHSLEPMRHYLTIIQRNFSYASPASLSRIMLSVIGDEGTTGIVNMYSDERRAAETYDLSGRRVPAGTSQRGLVIENGKVIYKKQ